MEVHPQLAPGSLFIHSPYNMVKQEPNASPDQGDLSNDNTFMGNPTDMLFTASHFSFMATNNNHETLNHNHSRHCTKGRALAADRKRPYPCNLCPSKFGSKMELEEHQNSHTGQKPFECDVCKARFNRRSTLWNHKRIHSDAKPFVCSVCQMTFKWKNSLKCHKEMHLRKNESSTVIDSDLRQLTYATAAKRSKMEQEAAVNGVEGVTTTVSSPLITTTNPKKKSCKSSSSSTSSVSSSATSGISQAGSSSSLAVSSQPIPIDLDPALDSILQHNNGILVQLCSEVDPNLSRHSILGMDDSGILSGHTSHLFQDIKGELIYNQQSGGHNGMNCSPQSLNVNVQIPLSNMFNFRSLGHQQLPSVHHLTSTSLPSVSVQMEYQNDLSQPHYIVTAQQDNSMMPTLSYPQGLDQCVVITAGQDYMTNFDYVSIPSYEQQQSQQGEDSSNGQNGNMGNGFEEKAIPQSNW